MYCPKCDTPLHMTERAGIEVDYCMSCRGVWLNEGELDLIVRRLAEQYDLAEQVQTAPKRKRKKRRDDHNRDDYYKPRRKKSALKQTLKELADVFD